MKVPSNKGGIALWAFQHQALVSQACRAAIWSSAHIFAKFYQVDVQASVKAGLGQKVLQSAL